MAPLASVGTIPDGTKPDLSDERKAFDSVDESEKKPASKEKVDTEVEDTDESTDEGEGEEEAEDKEASGESDTEDDEEDGEKEDEEGEEEDEEDDEELGSDSLYQEIKKRDPKLLKELPELRKVIFREQQFTELFSSVEEAKESRDKSEVLNQFDRDIKAGNSETLLDALQGKTLENFVANFIPTLEAKSKDLYFGVVYPELKKMLRAAAASGDERLVASAKNLNWFVFGDQDLAKNEGLQPGKKKDEKDDALTEREKAFEKRQFDSFANDVANVAERRVMKRITTGFDNSGLSPLLQNKLVEEIFKRVDKAIVADVRHMGNVNNLWLQAKKAGFTTEWKDRLTSAYLSRAQVLIPKYRQQVLAEAKVSAKSGTETNKKKPTRIAAGSTSTNRAIPGKVSGKKVDWGKADERAMLDGNIPMKG